MPRVLLALLACLLLAATSCEDGSEPLHDLAEAAERTAAAGSFRYELVSVSDPGTPEETTMLGEGVIHPEQQRSWRLWRPEGGVFPGEDPDDACPEDRNEVIETPAVWYLFSPVWTECEPVWLEIDAQSLREEGTNLTAAAVIGLGTVPAVDAMDALVYLQGAPGQAELVGAEDVDGEQTSRYRFVPEAGDAAEIDVWLDDRGHVRKLHHAGAQINTLELFEVGSAPRIPTRPDGEVRSGDWLVRLFLDMESG